MPHPHLVQLDVPCDAAVAQQWQNMTSQVRHSIFETNSSSTHSLTISADEIITPRISPQALRNGVLVVHPAQYGWEWARYYRIENKLSYLLTQFGGSALKDARPGPKFMEWLKSTDDRIRHVVDTVERTTSCRVEVEAPILHETSMGPYVESESWHVGNELIGDENKLFAFLFSDHSFVQTGNDNESCGEFIRNDLDEVERFIPDLQHAAPAGEDGIWMSSAAPYSHNAIAISHPRHGTIDFGETIFSVETWLADAMDAATCTKARFTGRRRWRLENPPELKPLAAQDTRDLVFRLIEGMHRDEDATMRIGVLEDGDFTALVDSDRVYGFDFAHEIFLSMTPQTVDKVWAAAHAIQHRLAERNAALTLSAP